MWWKKEPVICAKKSSCFVHSSVHSGDCVFVCSAKALRNHFYNQRSMCERFQVTIWGFCTVSRQVEDGLLQLCWEHCVVFPLLVLMEACRGCVSETAFWLAGVLIRCGSSLPLLAFKKRRQPIGRDWLQGTSEDTRCTLWHFSKVTAVTGTIGATGTTSHSSLHIAGEWAPTVCTECKCLLCRSDAGQGAEHVLGALLETHFIVNRTVRRTSRAGLWSPPTITRDGFPSSRRWSHQLWHLSGGLGQDSVSGLAREGRPEYDLLLRQWDLRCKWKQWSQISSDHAGVIRQTCTSLESPTL